MSSGAQVLTLNSDIQHNTFRHLRHCRFDSSQHAHLLWTLLAPPKIDPPSSRMEVGGDATAFAEMAPLEFDGQVKRIQQIEGSSMIRIETQDGKEHVRTRYYSLREPEMLINRAFGNHENFGMHTAGRAMLSTCLEYQTLQLDPDIEVAKVQLKCSSCDSSCNIYVQKQMESQLINIKDSSFDCDRCVAKDNYRIHMKNCPETLSAARMLKIQTLATDEYDSKHPGALDHDQRIEREKVSSVALTSAQIKQCETDARDELRAGGGMKLTEAQIKRCESDARVEYRSTHGLATTDKGVRRQEKQQAALIEWKKRNALEELRRNGQSHAGIVDEESVQLLAIQKQADMLETLTNEAVAALRRVEKVRTDGIQAIVDKMVSGDMDKKNAEWSANFKTPLPDWQLALKYAGTPDTIKPESETGTQDGEHAVVPLVDSLEDSEAEPENFESDQEEMNASEDEAHVPPPSAVGHKRKNPFAGREEDIEVAEDCILNEAASNMESVTAMTTGSKRAKLEHNLQQPEHGAQAAAEDIINTASSSGTGGFEATLPSSAAGASEAGGEVDPLGLPRGHTTLTYKMSALCDESGFDGYFAAMDSK
ncbi:hypothetical protein HII31_04721 [Pseudocercospora fuligena]|uniref:Uncharacterized protein n=1 Tax=Pseudocercospora fuligena TaxID=685502 RepID=A0A8H6VIQ9_9PEZI|nr:hypothetical protein HII31_04721 [Pseudocercospora fuligena]